MYNIMSKTAWPMELVKPYGAFHLIFFLGGLLISFLISFKLRNIEIKKLNKILFWLGIFLLISELYKQLFYTFYIGKGLYQWWIFPFQLCSIPMYFALAARYIHNKKVYTAMMVFLISYNLLGGFTAFLEPSGLIHPYWTLTIHAFIWHMMIVFMGLLIGMNNHLKFKMKDFKGNIILFLCLCLLAFIINVIVKNGINMFFVGPENSSIIVFKTISQKYGWFINDLFYLFALTLGAFIFYYPFTKLKKKYNE